VILSSSKDLKDIEKKTQEVYENKAHEYDEKRNRTLFEKRYLDIVLKGIPQDGKVLDLGCGGGEPIARYFIENGVDVKGIDYSHNMINICRERFPEYEWVKDDMRDLKVEGSFDAVVSWGAFFHLTIDQQRYTLPKICHLLNVNGFLLITVGDQEGEVTGTVAGENVYHASLSKNEYENILHDNGLDILEFNINDPNCYGFSVLLGKKI
jgi:cyclopropane fatty-acyl-phospholipid synthase-like methyltransferase